MASAGTVVITMDADVAKLIKGVKTSQKQLTSLQRATRGAQQSLLNIAKAAAGFYVVTKSVDLAKSAISSFLETSSQFEQYETTLKSITGSSEQAKKSMDWIGDFTARTPFQLNQTTEAFVKMKAYGLDPMDGTLSTLGDTASAMGKDIIQAVEAMADAVTGENERLKEFGVKASKQGEKIAYAWSDSSGKSRNIVIQNNKEMIQSTLNAIFNEKYVGAMEAQSNTWNGIISNMSDSWTMFQKDVMSEGLFAYFKSLAKIISGYMRTGFGDAKTAAKGFSDGVIEYINGAIRAVGFLKDAVSGMSLAFKAVQYGVLFMSKAVMQALNAPMQAINYLIDRYNALGDVLGYSKATMSAPTIDTTWTDRTMAQLKQEMGNIVDELASGSGQKLAEKIIGKTQEGIAGVTSELDELAKRKEEAKATLDAIGAGYGGVTKSTKSAGSAAKKAAKEVDKLTKKYYELTGQNEKLFGMDVDKQLGELVKSGRFTAEQIGKAYDGMWKEYQDKGKDANNDIVSDLKTNLSDAVGNLASAYREGGMAAVGDQIGNMLVNGLNALLPGLGTVIDTIGALFSSHVTQAEIDASKGRVEFSDESLANLGSLFESAQYPMLEVTNKMHNHIRNMDANFYSIARAFSSQASSGGIDLTGANFVNTMESGFLGFSSKSISLIGTGLQFELQNLSEMMNEAELNVQSYTTTLVQKSSFWGLVKSSKIKETYKDLPPEIVRDMADSFANGYAAIMTAGVSLGLNESSLTNALNAAQVDLGKIDFTGLGTDEINDRLSQAYSEAFSGVINGIDEFTGLVSRYAQGTEYALETLVRISTEFDQASHMFGLIGKEFKDGGTVSVAKQFVETFTREVEQAVQGNGLFDDGVINPLTAVAQMVEESYEELITRMVDVTYTAQMQMLDIVASTGGLTNFQDAMGAFMSGFYTDAEQLGFMTKSMEQSFASLGLITPQTNAEFRALLETMDTSTEAGSYLYGQVLLLADGFNAMTDASDSLIKATEDASKALQEEARNKQLSELQSLVSFKEGILDSIVGAYSGSLSYLTNSQKATYLDRMASSTGNVDYLLKSLENKLKVSETREDYAPEFERYIYELKQQEPEKTLDDVVSELETHTKKLEEIESALAKAPFQGVI